MSLKYGLLGLLNYHDMTGYDLNKAFKTSAHSFWRAQTSQIYRELNAMEKEGWLTSQIKIQTDKPNKRIYSITKEGKDALLDWLSEDRTDENQCLQSSFIMQVFFAGERTLEENLKMIQSYRAACLRKLKELDAANHDIVFYKQFVGPEMRPFYWGLTARYGELYHKMNLQWADETIGKLEALLKEKNAQTES